MVSRKHFFQRFHHLVGSVAGRGRGIDLRAAIQVVAHDEFRPGSPLDSSERTQRHHLVVGIPDIELPEVVEIRPVGPFGLNVDLPITPETVEVIDKSAPHKRLDGFVDIA